MRQDDDLKYFESSDFKEVLAQYEQMLRTGVRVYMDAEDLTDVAEYYAMVMHDEASADEAIDYALELHPDAVDPLVFRARRVMLEGNAEEAKVLCDAIPDQQDHEVNYLRAELMVRDGHVEEAAHYLLQLAEGVESDQDFFYYDSAYIFIDYHEYEHAQNFAEKLEAMAPMWYKTFQLRADILLGEEKYEPALTYIERMLDRDPFSVEVWNWRAEAYCGLMNFDKALESVEYALAVDPSNIRALQLQAWAFLQQHNSEKAHELYLRLHQTDENNEINWLNDSFCLLELNRNAEALEAIEQAEHMADGFSTEQAAIYEQHALVLSRLHRVEEALAYLEKAWDIGAFEERTDFMLFKARIYAENGQSEMAVQMIREAADLFPDNDLEEADILLSGGRILYDEECPAEAVELLQAALSKPLDEKHQPIAQAMVILAQHKLGLYTQALMGLRQLLDHPTEDSLDLLSSLFPEGTPPTDYGYLYEQFVSSQPHE